MHRLGGGHCVMYPSQETELEMGVLVVFAWSLDEDALLNSLP